MGALDVLRNAITEGNTDRIFDLALRSDVYSAEEIGHLLQSMCVPIPEAFEFTFAGSGHSGIPKPNISTLISIYLSAMGQKCVKVGSVKKTGLFGSADFMRMIPSCMSLEFERGLFRFYDVDELMPWKRYQNLLRINPSFDAFFRSQLINPVQAKCKIAGVVGLDASFAYSALQHYPAPTIQYVLTCRCGGVWIDEPLGGDVYVNGDCRFAFPDSPIPNLSTRDIIKLDAELLLGEVENQTWENYFLRSLAVVYSLYMKLDIKKALTDCQTAYNEKIVLSGKNKKLISSLRQFARQ